MFAKIQISLPPSLQDNSNALPPAKAIDQIPTLCPASLPAGLTLIGALIKSIKKANNMHRVQIAGKFNCIGKFVEINARV